MSTNYLVQPEYSAPRKADYKTQASINKKWKPISSKESMKICPNGIMGNIGSLMVVDRKTKKVVLLDDNTYDFDRKKYAPLYETISAALALYRGICIIDNPIVETEGGAEYKQPWKFKLQHIETGNVFAIGEWKGAFGVWTQYHNMKSVPEKFKKDIVQFLNLMFSDKSPHPYDKTTAGSVA